MKAALTTAALPLALVFLAPLGAHADEGFDVVTLGARGGIEDGNLSAFMIAPAGDPRAVTCDAGALVNGLRVADGKGVFDQVEVPADSSYTRIGYVLTEQIKAYLITHAHMDHLAGLVIASPDDSNKPIYALASVNERIQRNYFNWEAWPNFGTEGKEPQLKKYELRDLPAGQKTSLEGTAMDVTAFPLSHSGVESTAFLIDSGDDALLCFGDTGPDAVEQTTRIKDVWGAVAERVKQKQLRGIIVEVSYTNAQPDKFLFGHLTPNHLLAALKDLESMAGPSSLKDLPIVISHIKYSLKKGEAPQEIILRELQEGNTPQVRFIVPEQGQNWRF